MYLRWQAHGLHSASVSVFVFEIDCVGAICSVVIRTTVGRIRWSAVLTNPRLAVVAPVPPEEIVLREYCQYYCFG